MEKDHIAEQIGWLDGIFTHPRNSNLFTNALHTLIQKELSNRWVHENRLELLHDLAKKYGEGEMLAVIDKIIYENCKYDWEQVGREKGNSLNNFIKILWKPLKDIGFEYSIEKKGNKTVFCVTKCPLYDLAKKLGAEKWMYHLLCLTDEPAITGFNSRIKFDRSRTLMQGFPDCDHCYTELS
ncbi:MAG: L-2-amino-thiazoline-4-carboxylic acid hydrolase [Spirochaetales bacterium]|nr:L-2-amino-thiazoline-4-carboxylic acid hydrolase [Spirochaetales bacterium]